MKISYPVFFSRARSGHGSSVPARDSAERARPRCRHSSLGSTWTFGPGPASGPRRPSRRDGTAESATTSLTIVSDHGTAGERVDRTCQSPRRRQDADDRDVLERDLPGVQQARHLREADEDHTAGGLDQTHGECRHRLVAGALDDRVQPVGFRCRELIELPGAAHPQRSCERERSFAPSADVHLGVGHIMVPLALLIETNYAPPVALQLAIYLPMTFIVA